MSNGMSAALRSYTGGSVNPTVQTPSMSAPTIGAYGIAPRPPAQAPAQQPMPPPGQTQPPEQQVPQQPPAQPPAQQGPTNRELVASLRGLSDRDRQWFGQLFADPQNQGLAGSRSWTTTDPDALREQVRTGGLNQQNQARMLRMLNMTPGFSTPPPLNPAPPGQTQPYQSFMGGMNAYRGR